MILKNKKRCQTTKQHFTIWAVNMARLAAWVPVLSCGMCIFYIQARLTECSTWSAQPTCKDKPLYKPSSDEGSHPRSRQVKQNAAPDLEARPDRRSEAGDRMRDPTAAAEDFQEERVRAPDPAPRELQPCGTCSSRARTRPAHRCGDGRLHAGAAFFSKSLGAETLA